jgi:predicted transposase YdaD
MLKTTPFKVSIYRSVYERQRKNVADPQPLHLTDEDYTRRIVEYVENLKMNKEDRKMYESVFERVYKEEGIKEGIKEGGDKRAFEIARNFLADGVSPEIVARNTGLAPEEIRALMN